MLGRWMRLITITNQSSVPMASEEFDGAGRMKPGPLYDYVVKRLGIRIAGAWREGHGRTPTLDFDEVAGTAIGRQRDDRASSRVVVATATT